MSLKTKVLIQNVPHNPLSPTMTLGSKQRPLSRRIVTHRNTQQTTASRIHVVASSHAIMTTRPTNGCTSGWSSLRLGASTSRQPVDTREWTRQTSLVGRYVICFARSSLPHRTPAFLLSMALIFYPNLIYQSSRRVFYSSSPNTTLKYIKLT